MFCPNCGSRMNDGARFCPSCGAPANEVPLPQQPMDAPPAFGSQGPAMQGQSGYSLPPGVECLEDGTLCWTYFQSLWSNPTILYTLLKVMGVAVLIVMLIIGALA